MSSSPDQTVLLRIQLDPGKTIAEMEKVTRELTLNKDAQTELNKARRLGQVDADTYAQRSVALSNTIRQQTRQLGDLRKDLDLYNASIEGSGTSYKNVSASLGLALRTYQQLEGSADNNTAATKTLSDVIDLYRQRLIQTDRAQGSYHRVIGQYPQLSAEAQQGLATLTDELEKLRQEQAEAAKSGGPVSPEATKRIQELEGALAQAKVANTEYGASVVDLKRKLADLTAARDLAQDKEAVQQLNAAILDTNAALQEAVGKVDEFGEKIEKNAKQEELATLGDAFAGVTGAIQLSTLAMLDQEDADRATAVATQLLAQAEAARNVQIGLASARDAAHIVLLKAKNLLFAEGTTAVAAGTAATTANAAATTAQATATGGATLAQRALNLAMTLNPVGLVVVAIGALVGAYLAWRGASEKTKREVVDITEKVLRFGTPIGLVVTGLQKLYEKSETVRKVLDPLGKLFDVVAGKALSAAREAGEAVGLLDTAAEKAVKAQELRVASQKKRLEASDLIIGKYKEEARAAELAGESLEKSRALERKGLADQLEQERKYVDRLFELRQRRKNNGKQLTEEEEKDLAEHQVKAQELQNNLLEFDIQTRDKVVALRKKDLDASKSAVERARKLGEQQLQDEYATRKQLLNNRQQQIARLLEVVQKGSEDEETLLREQARNVTDIQLADNSAAQIGLLKKQQQALLGARREIQANGNAEQLKLDQRFATERAARAFDLAMQGNQAVLAATREGSSEELRLRQEALALQLDADIRAIDKTKTAEERAAQERLLRAQAQRDLTQLEYDDSVQKLEDFLADKRQAIERERAQGTLTEEQYQRKLAAFEQASIQARIVLNQDYKRDTTELTRQRVDAQLSEEARLTSDTRAELKGRMDAAAAFGQQVGELFADSLQEQGQELESFVTGFILILLDALQKQAQAALAAAVFTSTAGNLTTPDSIATAGVAGVAKAALMNAALAAAFGIFKAAVRQSLTQPSESRFAGGTVLGGAPHSRGGTQLFSRSGRHWGEAEEFEMVLTKNVYLTPGLREAANALNMAAGGRNLLAGLSGSTAPRMDLGRLLVPASALPGGAPWPTRVALGNVLAPPSFVADYLRAGAGGLGGVGVVEVPTPVIDYDQLAQALGRVNIYTKTQEIMASMDKVKYTQNVLRKD